MRLIREADVSLRAVRMPEAGLNERERKVLIPSAIAVFVLFVRGAAFSFFVVLPLTLAFCVRMNEFLNFTLLWDAADYFNLVVWVSVALGAFFQFPLVTAPWFWSCWGW